MFIYVLGYLRFDKKRCLTCLEKFIRNVWGFILYAFLWRKTGWIIDRSTSAKLSFLDTKKDIIEQKAHLWCIWDLLECQQKKIIKGKAFIISLFLTFVVHLPGWNMFFMVLYVWHCPQIIAWCAFAVKPFWNSGCINKKLSFILMYYTCNFMKVKYL